MELSESAAVRPSVWVFKISEITVFLLCGESEELSMIAEYSCSSRPASSLSLETCLSVVRWTDNMIPLKISTIAALIAGINDTNSFS